MKKKNINIILLGAGLSISLNAAAEMGIMGSHPITVEIPALPGGFNFTLEGLYLQPLSSNSNDKTYALYNFGPIFPPPPKSNDVPVNLDTPSYAFGFNVGIGYTFSNTSVDTQLSWTHFSTTTNNSMNFTPAAGQFINLLIPTVTGGGTDHATYINLSAPGDFTNVSNTLTDQYDAVDLDIGQHIIFGNCFATRLFAGLRYARLEHNLDTDYSGHGAINTPMRGDFVAETTATSQFNGIGPRFGINSRYSLFSNFGITSTVAGGVLIGNTDNTSSVYETYVGAASPLFTENITLENETLALPFLDFKIGADYIIPTSAGVNVILEGGYQHSLYFGFRDTIYFATPYTDANAVPHTESTNLSYGGAYLGVTIRMT